ncbi:Small subunit processome component 20 [Orchesella cincta]|uniref:Small subunit processome component 20 n=1 Tax=Orchesella cincta TaxID=48709 RepID=A0A1D2MR68_ORCCI|nr:Small subunit processome component 20 [Orchesella cincta]
MYNFQTQKRIVNVLNASSLKGTTWNCCSLMTEAENGIKNGEFEHNSNYYTRLILVFSRLNSKNCEACLQSCTQIFISILNQDQLNPKAVPAIFYLLQVFITQIPLSESVMDLLPINELLLKLKPSLSASSESFYPWSLKVLDVIIYFIKATKFVSHQQEIKSFIEEEWESLTSNLQSGYRMIRALTVSSILNALNVIGGASEKTVEMLDKFVQIENMCLTNSKFVSLAKAVLTECKVIIGSDTYEVKLKLLCLKYALGIMYTNFSLIWGPCVEVIRHAGKHIDMASYWKVFGAHFCKSQGCAIETSEDAPLKMFSCSEDETSISSKFLESCDLVNVNHELWESALKYLTYSQDVQKAAWKFLFAKRKNKLKNYKEDIDEILNSESMDPVHKFRIDAVDVSLNKQYESETIERRTLLMDIIIRILIGKERVMKGDKRTQVLRFLAGCTEADARKYLDLTVGSADEVQQLSPKIIEIKINKMTSALRTWRYKFPDILDQMVHGVCDLVCAVDSSVKPLSRKSMDPEEEIPEEVFEEQKRADLKAGRLCMVAFFTSLPRLDMKQETLDRIFNVFIWPALHDITTTSVGSVSWILKLFLVWSTYERYHVLLTKCNEGDMCQSPMWRLFDLLDSKSAVFEVKKYILGIVLNLSNPPEVPEEDSDEPVERYLNCSNSPLSVSGTHQFETSESIGLNIILLRKEVILNLFQDAQVFKKFTSQSGGGGCLALISLLAGFTSDGLLNEKLCSIIIDTFGMHRNNEENLFNSIVAVGKLLCNIHDPLALLMKLVTNFSWISGRRLRTALVETLVCKLAKQFERVLIAIMDAFHFDLKLACPEDNRNEERSIGQQNVETSKDVAIVNPEDDKDSNDDEKEEFTIPKAAASTSVQVITLVPQAAAVRCHGILKSSIIPKLRKFLHFEETATHKLSRAKKTVDDDVILKIPCTIALVKLLKKIPKAEGQNGIRSIIPSIAAGLRNELVSVRNTLRKTLLSVIKELGTSHLKAVIGYLKSSLQRGYQKHVLNYTVAYLLRCLESELKANPHHVPVKEIMSLCEDELYGVMQEEKELAAIKQKTREASKSNACPILKICSKCVSGLQQLNSLIEPALKHISEKKSLKVAKASRQWLSSVSEGLSDNTTVNYYELLNWLLEVIKKDESQEELDKSSNDGQPPNKKPKLLETIKDSRLIPSAKRKTVLEGKVGSHLLLTEFALTALYTGKAPKVRERLGDVLKSLFKLEKRRSLTRLLLKLLMMDKHVPELDTFFLIIGLVIDDTKVFSHEDLSVIIDTVKDVLILFHCRNCVRETIA